MSTRAQRPKKPAASSQRKKHRFFAKKRVGRPVATSESEPQKSTSKAAEAAEQIMKIKPTTKRGGVIVELDRRDDQLLTKGARETNPAFRLKKILVPLDFSDSSKKALSYARPFAEQFGAEITLLHVVERAATSESYYFIPPGLEEANVRREQDLRTKLCELREQEIGAEIRGDTLVQFGQPCHEIVRVAENEQADLIILSTHGYTGLKHALLGSTAERVVRRAPCPVLVVREREHDFI